MFTISISQCQRSSSLLVEVVEKNLMKPKEMNCNHKIRLESRLVQFFIQTPNHMVGPVMPSAHPPSWPHLTSSKIYLWVTSWYSDISLPLYGLSFSSQPLFQGDFFHEGPFEQPWISWDIEQHSVTSQQQLGLFQTFFLFFINAFLHSTSIS